MLLVLSLRNLSFFFPLRNFFLLCIQIFQLDCIVNTTSVEKKQGQTFLCLKIDLLSILICNSTYIKHKQNSFEQNWLLTANCYCIWQVSKFSRFLRVNELAYAKKSKMHHTSIGYSSKKGTPYYILNILYQQALVIYKFEHIHLQVKALQI